MARIKIRYCVVWNYEPRASRVAALIKDKLKLGAEIEPGGRGEFTVWVDGVKVAEKTRTGFPGEPAIVEAVSKAIAK